MTPRRSPPQRSSIPAAELFNPSTQTFSTAGSLGIARSGAGAALLQSGTVLVVGGTRVNSTPLASAELFDPQDGLTPDLSGIALSARQQPPSAQRKPPL